MWNRKDTEEKPRDMTPQNTYQAPTAHPAPPTISKTTETTRGSSMNSIVNIGQSIFISGELSGNEDLTIEGRVEGRIELREHNLVIGPKGQIKAELHAKTVTVHGEVVGNIRGGDRVEISASGTVRGDITAPRIVIADGARFKGSVDMEKAGDPSVVRKSSPAPAPAAAVEATRPVVATTTV
jgi:cytoskeletal protein CcmA (bactofilin family)